MEYLQAYRLISRTPPFPGRFIVPLNVYKFGLIYFDIAEKETQGYSTFFKNYPQSCITRRKESYDADNFYYFFQQVTPPGKSASKIDIFLGSSLENIQPSEYS